MVVTKFPPRLPFENGSQYAYRALHGAILRLQLFPGEALSDAALAEQLSVSRTPIREAMFRLRGENLVDVFPQKGSSVSLIDLDLVEESFFMRSQLEPAVLDRLKQNLTLSARSQLRQNLEAQRDILEKNADPDAFFTYDQTFHRCIYQNAGLSTIWQSIESTSTHYDRLRYMDVLIGVYRMRSIYEQHVALFEMLINPNLTADFSAFCKQHLAGYRQHMDQYSSHFGSYFKKD